MAKKEEEKKTDEYEMPPEIAAAKAKLEAKTGKKYKYRPKEATPKIHEMLVHGAPESQGRPRTWTEMIVPPAILAILFFLSFLVFQHVVDPSTAPEMILPISKNRMAMEQCAQHAQAKNEIPEVKAEEKTEL